MPRSSRSRPGLAAPNLLIAAAALVALVAIAGCSLGVVTSGPSGSPGTPTPVVTPDAPLPTAVPNGPTGVPPTGVPQPSTPPSPLVPSTPQPDGVDGIVIPLDVFLPDDVQLAISDREGLIQQAATGQAGDGMSVRWGQAVVRNTGPRTLEVTWTGIPRDELVTLVARSDGDRVLLRFGQEAPPANSDAMGADRVVVLTFAEPIDAGHVVTEFTTVDD
jgi:hypothetical protein